MGELGILSRVLCNIVGDSPFTYASIEKAVAPGQLTIKQVRMIYSLFHNKFLL
ncbi:MAG: type I 3-dehydroquinate dehydratase [Candidatus Nitrosocosmicus sp.]